MRRLRISTTSSGQDGTGGCSESLDETQSLCPAGWRRRLCVLLFHRMHRGYMSDYFQSVHQHGVWNFHRSSRRLVVEAEISGRCLTRSGATLHLMNRRISGRNQYMPVYDYQCNTCKTTYDVFHKVREVIDDVVCPSCTSKEYTRLISAPNVAVGHGPSAGNPRSCSTDAGCCGGTCGMD